MHSFILVGTDKKLIDIEIKKIAKTYGAQTLEFELKKIEDVRDLGKFTKLKVKKPSVVVVRDIEKATEEALNAFLKNLEEPQENLKYVLTTTSEYQLLPTIISRCHVIRTKNTPKLRLKNKKMLNKFLKSSQGKKLMFVSKITKRQDAEKFLEEFLIFLHNKLNEDNIDFKTAADNLKSAQNTLYTIRKNGNVTLHLLNLIIKLDS